MKGLAAVLRTLVENVTGPGRPRLLAYVELFSSRYALPDRKVVTLTRSDNPIP